MTRAILIEYQTNWEEPDAVNYTKYTLLYGIISLLSHPLISSLIYLRLFGSLGFVYFLIFLFSMAGFIISPIAIFLTYRYKKKCERSLYSDIGIICATVSLIIFLIGAFMVFGMAMFDYS